MITDIKGEIAQSSATRGGEGDKKFIRLLRDGSISTASFLQSMILEGKGYMTFEGVLSTPAVGGGVAAVVDADRPNLTLGVPDGTSIFLFRVTGQALTPLLATDADESEMVLGVHVGTKITVAAATALVPRNLRTGLGQGSVIDAEKTHSTNIATSPTLELELAHAIAVGDMNGTPANALWGFLEMNYEPAVVPVVKGPSTVIFYRGGTVATTGFTQAFWIEIASSDLT